MDCNLACRCLPRLRWPPACCCSCLAALVLARLRLGQSWSSRRLAAWRRSLACSTTSSTPPRGHARLPLLPPFLPLFLSRRRLPKLRTWVGNQLDRKLGILRVETERGIASCGFERLTVRPCIWGGGSSRREQFRPYGLYSLMGRNIWSFVFGHLISKQLNRIATDELIPKFSPKFWVGQEHPAHPLAPPEGWQQCRVEDACTFDCS
jgi:hypothetical protein